MHARPYDLRGSFASLLIQQGKNVVDVATQLVRTPETCLRYYARLFDEAPEHPGPGGGSDPRCAPSVRPRAPRRVTGGRALDALARAGDHHRCADLAIYLHL
jgi:hypothetical protein